MPNNEGDGRMEHQRQLWSALDLAAYGLAFHIAQERKNGLGALGAAVHDLETARIIALEGIGFQAAWNLAIKRVGTSNEQIVRWAEEFLDAWAARVARDGFEGASANTLARLWGEYKERPPRSLAEVEELIQELREIIGRSPADPEHRELLDFVPGGSAREVREVLSRRRDR